MADTPADSYSELRRLRPELFEGRDESGFVILDAPGKAAICYEDRFIYLIRDWVRFPGGEEGSYIRIVPRNGNGAAVLPLVGDQLLLLRHHRHATGREHLEIPRGFAEQMESQAIGAIRELMEETGLVVEALKPLGSMTPDTGLLGSTVGLYLAICSVPSTGIRTESLASPALMPIADVAASIRDGTIVDSFTMAAFLRARLRGHI